VKSLWGLALVVVAVVMGGTGGVLVSVAESPGPPTPTTVVCPTATVQGPTATAQGSGGPTESTSLQGSETPGECPNSEHGAPRDAPYLVLPAYPGTT
jgi:hypothetical protein